MGDHDANIDTLHTTKNKAKISTPVPNKLKIRRGGGMQLRRMGITDGFYDDANIDTLHKAKISTPVPKQAENKNHTYKSLLFPL